MADPSPGCPQCGEPLAATATTCLHCGYTRAAVPGPAPNGPQVGGVGPSTRAGASAPSDGRSGEIARRLSRLKQWAEGAQGLGVTVASLPPWAEDAARHGPGAEGWIEVVQGVERLAQKKIVTALEGWEREARSRLSRLEAYSVDGRLENDQIDDVLHAARQGEVTLALQTFQQVDKVVALKERHLDQAREELERLVSFLRDMEALGLDPPVSPDDASADLERQLRGGHLAALKAQLRTMRLQAVNRLKSGVPFYVSEYGEYLVRERADGVAIELEVAELARAANSFVKGHPEEAVRRLRLLQQVHGAGFPRAAGRKRKDRDATGSSRAA